MKHLYPTAHEFISKCENVLQSYLSFHCFPLGTEALESAGPVAAELDLHVVVVAGDGGGFAVPAVSSGSTSSASVGDLHVVPAAISPLQSETIERELHLVARRHPQIPILIYTYDIDYKKY